MSTSNFFKRHASAYFVVDGKRYYNSEGEELEQWEEGCEVVDDTEDELECILEYAKSEGWEKSEGWHGRDSYGLCEKWEDEDLILGTTTVEIKIEIDVNPGYYEACNLDWDLRFRIPGSGFDCRLSDYYSVEDLADEIADAFMDYEDVWNEGLKKMQKKNIVKKALARIEEVGLKADEFCKRMCTGVYAVSARFSNGETWYTKIA